MPSRSVSVVADPRGEFVSGTRRLLRTQGKRLRPVWASNACIMSRFQSNLVGSSSYPNCGDGRSERAIIDPQGDDFLHPVVFDMMNRGLIRAGIPDMNIFGANAERDGAVAADMCRGTELRKAISNRPGTMIAVPFRTSALMRFIAGEPRKPATKYPGGCRIYLAACRPERRGRG